MTADNVGRLRRISYDALFPLTFPIKALLRMSEGARIKTTATPYTRATEYSPSTTRILRAAASDQSTDTAQAVQDRS
jgi:hypothetical protein